MPRLEEVACTYSALILADDDIPITAEKISTILKAANVSVESIWPNLFAKALGSVNVKDLITNVGSLAAAGAVTSPATAAATTPAAAVGGSAAGPAAEAKKAEEKKEESDSEDEDMGFGLFD